MVNYLISIAGLTYMAFRLKNKSQQDPHLKIAGLSVKTLLNMAYLGIACFAILVLMVLGGYTK
jgi:hypothetical protein